MQSVIQILKVNEVKRGTSSKSGRPYEMQDAECLLLSESGEVDQVGVLRIPKELRDVVKPGTFTASFALSARYDTRQIEAVLTGLVPLPPAARPAPSAAPAPSSSK